MAGNRTRINCLEGSYADHYTTIASYVKGRKNVILLGRRNKNYFELECHVDFDFKKILKNW